MPNYLQSNKGFHIVFLISITFIFFVLMYIKDSYVLVWDTDFGFLKFIDRSKLHTQHPYVTGGFYVLNAKLPQLFFYGLIIWSILWVYVKLLFKNSTETFKWSSFVYAGSYAFAFLSFVILYLTIGNNYAYKTVASLKEFIQSPLWIFLILISFKFLNKEFKS